ncbi:NAD(P)/FAD-dependent oxidoreductase [Yoonia sp. 208BN28-4]|uniref:NAD(P)/FAD-dependent oxidoreductase n=1 Tax=Yoonia sp. 208BN28-4 TaxID=3126505 RepID=UPI0030948990
MVQSILVVGSGIIGAATALHLARDGHRVRVISAGAGPATATAFGWINASFYLDIAHHHLRVAGIAAWRRLASELALDVTWPGCVCWDMPPAELAATYDALRGVDYPVEMLTRAQVADMEPALRDAPQTALFFPEEGAAQSAAIPRQLLAAAQSFGAQLIENTPVTGVHMRNGRAAGVETAQGRLLADQVIVAAGTGTTALAQTAGVDIHLVPRPAYIVRTTPLRPMLNHILASPVGEIRQEASGQLLLPAALGHQGDTTTSLTHTPEAAADDTVARLKGMFHGLDNLRWSQVQRAERPVPEGGQPIVGALDNGLYVAVMHSGITLGPLMGQLIAREITHGLDADEAALLAPYRPRH